MRLQTIFAVLITLVRIYLGIKVISWLVINLIAAVPHSIEEIQTHLILILLDTWFSSQINNIIISEVKED
jgi:hypothetical protein